MAGTKAAGTAGGSTQRTPKHLDAAASGYTLDLTPHSWPPGQAPRTLPPEAIAKRPTISCSGCRDAKDKVCSSHSKSACRDCGQYITTAHKHLDYVGHAEATDRLLEVDPTWNWEPMAKDANGLPLLDVDGGMWITLTVCGMTRKGYGDAVGKRAGTTATKEIIGDALRNAAMRFGMALDLWAKTDLHAEPRTPPNRSWTPSGTSACGRRRSGWPVSDGRPRRPASSTSSCPAAAGRPSVTSSTHSSPSWKTPPSGTPR
ncbi:hypothetical protein ACFQ3Z_15805 [Streptomyces nogalater]